MSRRSVPLPLVLIPVLVLLLAPLPALAAERKSDQTVWGVEVFGSIYERVAGWFGSLAGVTKLGADIDPDGAPVSEGPLEGGAVAELGADIDPNG